MGSSLNRLETKLDHRKADTLSSLGICIKATVTHQSARNEACPLSTKFSCSLVLGPFSDLLPCTVRNFLHIPPAVSLLSGLVFLDLRLCCAICQKPMSLTGCLLTLLAIHLLSAPVFAPKTGLVGSRSSHPCLPFSSATALPCLQAHHQGNSPAKWHNKTPAA